MKKRKMFKRIGALALMLTLAISMMTVGVSAANESAATVDTSKSTSLTLYKYDTTAAESAGAWQNESYVSTGIYDESVNNTLNPYAIQGVEFSYIKLADLGILKTNEGAEHKVMPLYGFHEDVNSGSKATVEFLSAIGLTTNDAYTVEHDSNQNRIWYFQSDTLINALAAALEKNATTTKAALESYMASNNGTALPETDANGKTGAENMAQGLYLVIETRVPENVVSTTAPFLVSLPMTTIDGDEWNYSVTVYPKNETNDPTLDKYVREAQADTGKNGGTTNDIKDGYTHTATASDGDVIDCQVVSTLPTITSPATALTTYTFVDTLSKGIQYNGSLADKSDVKIEWFTDAACQNLVTTWTADSGTFTVEYKDYDPDTGSVMTIEMTDAGLKEINSATTVYNPETSLLRGYSDLTMRITYSATVNSDAAVTYGDSGNPNEIQLTWKRTNTDYFDTLNNCCHVYTYGIDLTKYFSDDAGNYKNVKFLLHNTTDGYYVQAKLNEAEGIYYVTGHTTKESEATLFSPMSKEPNHRKIMVEGLEDDTYVITETATDDGYVLLKEDITVAITSREGTGTCDLCKVNLMKASATVNGKTVAMDKNGDSANAIVPLTVTNTKGFDLPKTGGAGTVLFYALGGLAVLTAGASSILYFRKKKSR